MIVPTVAGSVALERISQAAPVLAPLPQGEALVSNNDYTLCTQMNGEM
mgnify:CR=1 FL=1